MSDRPLVSISPITADNVINVTVIETRLHMQIAMIRKKIRHGLEVWSMFLEDGRLAALHGLSFCDFTALLALATSAPKTDDVALQLVVQHIGKRHGAEHRDQIQRATAAHLWRAQAQPEIPGAAANQSVTEHE